MARGGRVMAAAVLMAVAACAPPGSEPVAPLPDRTPAPSPRAGAAPPPPDAGSATPAPAVRPRGFECRGEDPAWTLRLDGGHGDLVLPERTLSLAGELEATPTGAWTWLGLPEDDPERSFALLLVPGYCFPADGGAALPYSGELGFDDGRRGSGCCRPIDPD